MNKEEVTHQSLQEKHWAQVFDISKDQSGLVFFIQDGSVLDYSSHQATPVISPIGNLEGSGINLHSCLAVSLESKNPDVLGLAYQKVLVRPEKPKKGTEIR